MNVSRRAGLFHSCLLVAEHLNIRPLFLSCFYFVVVVQSLSRVRLFVTPWTTYSTAHQASLSFTISWSLSKLMSTESVMPSNHLIPLPLSLLPSVFPSIRVFSSEPALQIRWPEYWSFSFSISPSNEYSGFISFGLTGLISYSAKMFHLKKFYQQSHFSTISDETP